jgi:hypothetical protein
MHYKYIVDHGKNIKDGCTVTNSSGHRLWDSTGQVAHGKSLESLGQVNLNLEHQDRRNTWTEFFFSTVKLRSSLILGALNERAFKTVVSSLGLMNLNFS